MTVRSSAMGWLLSAAALGAGSPASHAEGGVPEKVVLAIGLKTGKPVSYVDQTVTRTTVILSKDLKELGVVAPRSEEQSVTEFSLEALEPAPKGGTRARLRFGRLTWKESGGRSLSSEERLSGDLLQLMQDTQRVALGGTEFTVTLDAGGVVRTVEGCEAAVKARRKSLGLDDTSTLLLSLAIDPDLVGDIVNAMLVAPPLPAGEVFVGRKWDDDDAARGVISFQLSLLRRTFRVTGIGPSEVKIEGKGSLVHRTRNVPRSMPDTMSSVSPKKSAATSVLRVSRDDGLPIEAKTTASASYRDKLLEMDSEWSQESRLQRVDRWPSAPAAPAPGDASPGK